MKTEPRRKERIMADKQRMGLLLERAPVGRMAVVTEDGPYAVALNYLYHEGCIYFHCAREGRKMDALRADPRVCFLVDEVGPQVLFDKGCGISQIYESVICFGRVEFIEDAGEKRLLLEKLVRKHLPADHALPSISDSNVEKTAVVKIIIESMSGKAHTLTESHTIIPGRS